MPATIALVECPSCGCLAVDFASAMTAGARFASGVGNVQQCAYCGNPIALPDHVRDESGRLSVRLSSAEVRSFVIQLVHQAASQARPEGTAASLPESGAVGTNLVAIARSHPKIAGAICVAIGCVALECLEHMFAISEAMLQHDNAIEQISIRAELERELLLEADSLERARMDAAHELEELSAAQSRRLEQLLEGVSGGVPQEPRGKPLDPAQALEAFIGRYNQMVLRIQALREALD